jgi:hypothetical protein
MPKKQKPLQTHEDREVQTLVDRIEKKASALPKQSQGSQMAWHGSRRWSLRFLQSGVQRSRDSNEEGCGRTREPWQAIYRTHLQAWSPHYERAGH